MRHPRKLVGDGRSFPILKKREYITSHESDEQERYEHDSSIHKQMAF